MRTTSPLTATLHASSVMLRPVTRALLRRVESWSAPAQVGSRRNAMVAATALAQRRAERIEVEDYLAGLPGRASVSAPERRSATAGPPELLEALEG